MCLPAVPERRTAKISQSNSEHGRTEDSGAPPNEIVPQNCPATARSSAPSTAIANPTMAAGSPNVSAQRYEPASEYFRTNSLVVVPPGSGVGPPTSIGAV